MIKNLLYILMFCLISQITLGASTDSGSDSNNYLNQYKAAKNLVNRGKRTNKSGQPRVSISGDVTIMLKDSKGFEHLMPNFKNWTKF